MTPVVSAHALERYMERTGCRSPERARNKIEICLLSGCEVDYDKKSQTRWIYGKGFIVCVRDNVVVTVFRPDSGRLRRKINKIFRPKHQRDLK